MSIQISKRWRKVTGKDNNSNERRVEAEKEFPGKVSFRFQGSFGHTIVVVINSCYLVDNFTLVVHDESGLFPVWFVCKTKIKIEFLVKRMFNEMTVSHIFKTFIMLIN